MIHPKPQDLIAIQYGGKYYHAIVLSKIIFGGGQLLFALYSVTEDIATPDAVLKTPLDGFHCIIDLLYAKQDNRIHRIARKISIGELDSFKYFRQSSPSYGHPSTWAIWDRSFNVVKTPEALTDAEWSYPLAACSGSGFMCKKVDERWKPEHDRFV